MNLYIKNIKINGLNIQLISTGSYIISLSFKNGNRDIWLKKHFKDFAVCKSDSLCDECIEQLNRYFSGSLKEFSVPIKIYATPFQQKIYAALLKIPYGTTISYGKLAELAGERSARAIGTALSHNPLPILIPCHRVIRSDGRLGGFCGDFSMTAIKQRLLQIEGIGISP